MKVWSVSGLGRDGVQSIIVEDVPAWVNGNDLYMGGHYYDFTIDHVKQKSEVYEFVWINGVPTGFDKCLKKWKDEVLVEAEVCRIAEEIKNGKTGKH